MKQYLNIFLLLILIFPNVVIAEYAMTAAQVKMLPDFCRNLSIGNFQADAKHLKRNGKFPGKHAQHYCHGLKSLNEGIIHSSKRSLKKAVGEFEYVLSRGPSTNALLPSCSLNQGKAYEALGNTQYAIRQYQNAIKLKPNYSSAYIALSDLYLKLGMDEEALTTIKTGLKYKKSSKGLNRRLKKMEDNTKIIKNQSSTIPSNNH